MRLTFPLVFVLVLVSAAHAQTTDWYTVDRDVVNRLVFEEKDRSEWLAELQAKPEKTAADELRIFQLAARSGDEAAALAALERFIALENPKPDTLYGTTHWASKTLQNPALARHLQELRMSGISRIVFVIGGSLGLGSNLLARADEEMSMSPMTFPHQLARVMLLEQLYRAEKISAGERYHK